MNKSVLLAAVMLSGALGACERSATPVATDAPAATAAADIDAVKKLESDFFAAFTAKKLDIVKAAYAPDAVMMLPDIAPFRGAAAIAGFYDAFAADTAGKFASNNEATVVGGDVAFSNGTYTVSYTNGETKQVESGQGYYVIVYKKQSDGSWKIVQDVASPTPS